MHVDKNPWKIVYFPFPVPTDDVDFCLEHLLGFNQPLLDLKV